MNLGLLNLALKMIKEDYKLSDSEIQVLSRRLMADEREFEKVWHLFRNRRSGKTDTFLETLTELIK